MASAVSSRALAPMNSTASCGTPVCSANSPSLIRSACIFRALPSTTFFFFMYLSRGAGAVGSFAPGKTACRAM